MNLGLVIVVLAGILILGQLVRAVIDSREPGDPYSVLFQAWLNTALLGGPFLLVTCPYLALLYFGRRRVPTLGRRAGALAIAVAVAGLTVTLFALDGLQYWDAWFGAGYPIAYATLVRLPPR